MNKLLAILEAADKMNMMKKALPICKDRWWSALLVVKYIFGKGGRTHGCIQGGENAELHRHVKPSSAG